MKVYAVDDLPASRGEVVARKGTLTYVGWVKDGANVIIQYQTKGQ